MGLDLRLQQKMAQQLVMTPQLQQAIKLLQLSHLEIADVLREELEQNPVLEEHDSYDPDSRSAAADRNDLGELAQNLSDPAYESLSDYRGGEAYDDVPMDQSPVDASNLSESLAQPDKPGEPEGQSEVAPPSLDESTDWEPFGEAPGTGSAAHGGGSDHDDLPSFEANLTCATSLTEHLRFGVQMLELSCADKEIAYLLVDEVGEDGYLSDDAVQSVADELEIGTAAVLDVLFYVQQLEPRGVAARNLRECLALQAAGLGNELVLRIIEDHLPLVERRNFSGIAKALQVSLAEVTAAIKLITQLEPRPGRAFCTVPPQYITPDIYVHRVADGYAITLNEDGLPRLQISNHYRSAMHGAALPTKSYLQEKMRSAAWLIRSIHMRQRTIYRVMESILKLQRDFFDRGVRYLRPLILKEVAEDVHMHESTISRVTTNKYVHTPQGIYELKYFFNSSIHCSGGDAMASESVRSHIQRLIGGENVAAPLSDQKIVEILAGKHIDIARRTVAKYREMLKIPSSSRRKRAH